MKVNKPQDNKPTLHVGDVVTIKNKDNLVVEIHAEGDTFYTYMNLETCCVWGDDFWYDDLDTLYKKHAITAQFFAPNTSMDIK